MDDNISEVSVVEQDLLMTVDDFARQERVSPRTVYRWIEMGRLDTVERLGKKYVNASIPLKTPSNDIDNVRSGTKSADDANTKPGGALQNVNIFEEYLKTLRENGRRNEISRHRWQVACFVSIFLFTVTLVAATALGLLYYYGTETLNQKLSVSSNELAAVEMDKTAALAKVEGINAELEAKIQPYKDEITRLQTRLDQAIARNNELRDRLDATYNRNLTLLERFTGKATEDETAENTKESSKAK